MFLLVLKEKAGRIPAIQLGSVVLLCSRSDTVRTVQLCLISSITEETAELECLEDKWHNPLIITQVLR